MNFDIKILDVAKERGVTKTGKDYTYLNVAFHKDGKIDGKKVMPFGNKEVFDTLSKAQKDEFYTVISEKNGEYWEWIAVARTNGAAPAPSTPPAASSGGNDKTTYRSGGNWETPEERAVKQQYIIRQSCLTNAINFIEVQGKKNPPIGDVLEVANLLVDWVNAKPPKEDKDETLDIKDDLPWEPD